MKNAAGVLVMLGLTFCSARDESKSGARTRVGSVRGLSGAVDVLRGGSIDWVRIADRAVLYEDDRVRTFKGAWALLAFDGGSVLRVEEESLISLGSGITVEHGAVAGELQVGLRLRTPSLEAESAAARDIVFR